MSRNHNDRANFQLLLMIVILCLGASMKEACAQGGDYFFDSFFQPRDCAECDSSNYQIMTDLVKIQGVSEELDIQVHMDIYLGAVDTINSVPITGWVEIKTMTEAIKYAIVAVYTDNTESNPMTVMQLSNGYGILYTKTRITLYTDFKVDGKYLMLTLTNMSADFRKLWEP